MHDHSFLVGLELGKFLTRLTRAEMRLDTIEKKVDDISSTMKRGAILAALWTFALIANASTDKAAVFAVELLTSVARR